MNFIKHVMVKSVLVLVVVFGLATKAHAATITGLSVSGTNLYAGQTSNYTITYTIPSANPNIMFYMRFPSSFDVTAVGSPMNLSNVSVTVNGTAATVDSAGSWALQGSTTAIRLVDSTVVTAGSAISVTLRNIVNPSSAGVYALSDFFATANSQGVQLDTASSIPNITITADTVNPTVPGIPTPSAPQSNDNTPTFTWTAASDAQTGIGSYLVKWSQNSDCNGGSSDTTTNTSYTISTPLADGSWYFCAAAQDNAGNTSAYTQAGLVIVDTVAPVLTTISSIAQYTTLNNAYYHFSSSEICSPFAQAATASIGTTETHIGSITGAGIDTTAYLSGIQSGGTYSVVFGCADPAGNTSNTLTMGPFTVYTPHSGGGSFVAASTSTGEALSFVLKSFDAKSRKAVFALNADPKTVQGYAISLDKNFADTSIAPYNTNTASIVLPDTKMHTVYFVYFSKTGHKTAVFSQVVGKQESAKKSVVKKAPIQKIKKKN